MGGDSKALLGAACCHRCSVLTDMEDQNLSPPNAQNPDRAESFTDGREVAQVPQHEF